LKYQDGERGKTRLFARDRTSSGNKTKKSETPRTPVSAPEQLGGPLHSESSVSYSRIYSIIVLDPKTTTFFGANNSEFIKSENN
jgi:hypothetical protein